MVLGILLILIGLSVVAMAAAWRSGYWLSSARSVMQWVSPPMVVATPVAGLLVASVGLMLIWPPAVILAFACAVGWVAVLALSARRGITGRLPAGLRPPDLSGNGATGSATPAPPMSRTRGIRTGPGTQPGSSSPRRQAR